MSQVLDGSVTDLEIGAFAIAMRIKGETHRRAGRLPATPRTSAASRCRRDAPAVRAALATTARASCPT